MLPRALEVLFVVASICVIILTIVAVVAVVFVMRATIELRDLIRSVRRRARFVSTFVRNLKDYV
jgi:hypothetical protein